MCTCDLTGFSILPPFANCCLTGLIHNFSQKNLVFGFHCTIDCSRPREENKFEYKHWKVNLLVISLSARLISPMESL